MSFDVLNTLNTRLEQDANTTLLIDGDSLAYLVASVADDLLEVSSIINDKISTMRLAAGARFVKVLLTAKDSPKGDRFAVASVKPYQGNRKNRMELTLLQPARDYLIYMRHACVSTVMESYAEADDLFRSIPAGDPLTRYIIASPDKDLRQIPGVHMDWHSLELYDAPNAYRNDVITGGKGDPTPKLFGSVMFWMQMLHGDTADNIPGLPFYINGETYKTGDKAGQIKQIPVGVVAATKLLANCYSDVDAYTTVSSLYASCYGDDWPVQMLEQAILLWLRYNPNDVFDVVNCPNAPLANLKGHPAIDVICNRITANYTLEV